jgi:hypothetical protein
MRLKKPPSEVIWAPFEGDLIGCVVAEALESGANFLAGSAIRHDPGGRG